MKFMVPNRRGHDLVLELSVSLLQPPRHAVRKAPSNRTHKYTYLLNLYTHGFRCNRLPRLVFPLLVYLVSSKQVFDFDEVFRAGSFARCKCFS